MTGLYEQSLDDCENEIDSIRQWISQNHFHANNRFLISYAVIKSSGTLELVLKRFVCDHLLRGANNEAQAYLTYSIVDASFNPSTGKIDWLLGNVNANWRSDFCVKISGTTEKGDLNSLVNLRNDLAHGRSISASIENIISYYSSGRAILNIVWDIMYPPQT